MKNIFESPGIFDFWQYVAGAELWKKRLVKDYVQPFLNARILDVGCGTGSVQKKINDELNVHYVGCDTNKEYISYAQKRLNKKGVFFCCSLSDLPENEYNFDIIIINAVLHHIPDKELNNLLREANKRLTQNGKLILSEPVWTTTQSFFEKYLMKRDRGKNIKTEKQYWELLQTTFHNLKSEIITDSHFIPWTVTVITAIK